MGLSRQWKVSTLPLEGEYLARFCHLSLAPKRLLWGRIGPGIDQLLTLSRCGRSPFLIFYRNESTPGDMVLAQQVVCMTIKKNQSHQTTKRSLILRSSTASSPYGQEQH
eukprot:5088511-Amphidinium_carterae.1